MGDVTVSVSTRERWFGGTSLFPLAVLFGLNLVDEFDRITFTTLAPEIRDALGMSDAAIVSIGSLAFASTILMALPVGYAADRWNRVTISIAAAALWGVAALATGLATSVFVVFAARFIAGTGRLVNDTVHPSLLSNYYPSTSLPLISAIHRSATNVGTVIAGPVAGLVAATLGWRAAFFLAAGPTVLLMAFATRLRDPRPVAKVGVVGVRPRGFLASFHQLRRTPTLRRLWITAFLYGGAFIPFLTTLLSVFLEREHAVAAGTRGAVFGLYGLGGIVGLFVGSWAAKAAFGDGKRGWLVQLVGLSIATFGAALMLMAAAPSANLAIALALLAAIGANVYLPPYTTLVALVTPMSLRSQGYTYSLFFYAIGAVVFSQVAAAIIAVYGVSVAMMVLGGAALVAGLVAISASSSVSRDVVAGGDASQGFQ